MQLFNVCSAIFRGRFLFVSAILAGLLGLGFTAPAQADTSSGDSDVPVAVNDTFGPVYADVVDFNALANDHDPQGRPLTILSYTQPQQPIYNHVPTVSLVNNVFHLSDVRPGSGTEVFKYTVSNGVETATATVTIVYKQINYPVTTVTKKISPKKIKKVKKYCKVKAHKKSCKKHHKLQNAKTGKIRFTNTNAAPISITYWNYNHAARRWHVQVPAGGSVVVSMQYAPSGDYLIYDAYLLDGASPPFLYTTQDATDYKY